MLDLINLEDVRSEMLSEAHFDIKSGQLYLSERLNDNGKLMYSKALLEALKSSDVQGFCDSFGLEFFNSYYQKRTKYGGCTPSKMPRNANRTLCESEFNRYYIRGVCLKAIALDQEFVTVYRARSSRNPRYESVQIEGKQLHSNELLNDLRSHIGVDTVLRLPPGPNSGMSVKL